MFNFKYSISGIILLRGRLPLAYKRHAPAAGIIHLNYIVSLRNTLSGSLACDLLRNHHNETRCQVTQDGVTCAQQANCTLVAVSGGQFKLDLWPAEMSSFDPPKIRKSTEHSNLSCYWISGRAKCCKNPSPWLNSNHPIKTKPKEQC